MKKPQFPDEKMLKSHKGGFKIDTWVLAKTSDETYLWDHSSLQEGVNYITVCKMSDYLLLEEENEQLKESKAQKLSLFIFLNIVFILLLSLHALSGDCLHRKKKVIKQPDRSAQFFNMPTKKGL